MTETKLIPKGTFICRSNILPQFINWKTKGIWCENTLVVSRLWKSIW